MLKKFNESKVENNLQISTNHIFVDTKEDSPSKCISCQSCFSGCPKDSFFRPSKIINEWVLKKYFSYKNENVEL